MSAFVGAKCCATFLSLVAIVVDASADNSAQDAATTTGTVTGYYYSIPHQRDYGTAIASLNRGALHLEARYNYEAMDSGSIFAGWNFAGGDSVTYQVTPIFGALFGQTRALIPGLEASVAYAEVDAYIEAEYVRDLGTASDSYFYAWSELGWKPVQWLRVGLVGQRSRDVENGRNFQRGLFVQLIGDKVTLGLYGFNPDSSSRYLIVALGVQF